MSRNGQVLLVTIVWWHTALKTVLLSALFDTNWRLFLVHCLMLHPTMLTGTEVITTMAWLHTMRVVLDDIFRPCSIRPVKHLGFESRFRKLVLINRNLKSDNAMTVSYVPQKRTNILCVKYPSRCFLSLFSTYYLKTMPIQIFGFICKSWGR